MLWKLIGGLGIIAIVAGTIYFLYNENRSLIIKIEQQQVALDPTKKALEETNKTIDEIIKDNKRNEEISKELERQIRTANEELDELIKILSNHNLKDLASKKGGLIERIINEATRKIFNDIERITNSK